MPASYSARYGPGRNWGWMLAYGILLVAVGIFAMVHPLATGLAIGVMLAISFLFAGVGALVAAVRDAGWQAKMVDLLYGVLALLAAFVCFANPFGGAVSLVWVIGILFLIMGGYELVAGFRTSHEKIWLILLGVVDILIGYWAAFSMPPDAALVALATLVGISFLLRGVFVALLALRLRGLARP